MNNTDTAISKDHKPFAQRLLGWYDVHARTMPWRVPPAQHAAGLRADPYQVWLSEVMLQQTQVATVRDYFLKFVSMWPKVDDLAAAELEDVLKAWAGLGYYSRARNLKKCADVVVAEYGGTFPSTFEALKKLPGIGDYTASAIASIAFDKPVPVLDGNVERVMARHQKIDTPFPGAKPEAKSLLENFLDQDRPGEFAQAMMDLGATLCSPKRPACALCPIKEDCAGFENGNAENYPYKQPKARKPTRKGAAFVLLNATGAVFLCKRENKGLLAGMTQVPTTDWNSRVDGATGREAGPVQANWQLKGTVRHTFTHFHLELEVWSAQGVIEIPIDGWWCEQQNLKTEALPSIMHKVLDTAL